jgi:flavin reductase (DIM6/NTAB) family NADH-FMN oxidoreductase RutF
MLINIEDKHPIILPAPVVAVGSYNEDKSPNIMCASWVGVACSTPPLISLSLRKATLTYENIVRNNELTISIPGEEKIEVMDYIGTISGRKVDKFEKTGLTEMKSEVVNAPIVGEFPVVMECRINSQTVLGTHTLFICEVLNIKVDDDYRIDGKLLDVEKIRPVSYVHQGRLYQYGGEILAKRGIPSKIIREGVVDNE